MASYTVNWKKKLGKGLKSLPKSVQEDFYQLVKDLKENGPMPKGWKNMGKLGMETTLTRMEQAYNDRKTTQVPTGRVIGVRGRVRRKIVFNRFPMSYERVGPAAR